MAEFAEKGGDFGMGGGFVDVPQHPAEEFFDFGAGGLEAGEVLDVAPLVAIQSGAEFEQDESLAADEADFEILAVFAGVEFLPEPRGQKREIEAMEGSGSVEPIRIEPEFLGDLGGRIFDAFRQREGADDIPLSFAKRHHVHVLGLAGAEPLDEQGAAASNNQPHRG
jgi:hypothetical protein